MICRMFMLILIPMFSLNYGVVFLVANNHRWQRRIRQCRTNICITSCTHGSKNTFGLSTYLSVIFKVVSGMWQCHKISKFISRIVNVSSVTLFNVWCVFVDMDLGVVGNMAELGITESLRCKRQMLVSAAEGGGDDSQSRQHHKSNAKEARTRSWTLIRLYYYNIYTRNMSVCLVNYNNSEKISWLHLQLDTSAMKCWKRYLQCYCHTYLWNH